MHKAIARSTVTALLALAPVASAPALASPALSSNGVIVRSLPEFERTPLAATTFDFDVSGIFSNDAYGAAINERFAVNVGSGARVTGIGWDVTLFADGPSWLEEAAVAIGNSTDPFLIQLRVGAGDNFPGIESYSSGGIIDLIGLGLDFFVDADGLLQLEFFETFDDFPFDWDAIWQSGALSFQVTTRDVVPAPGALGLLVAGAGLLGLAGLRRRAASA